MARVCSLFTIVMLAALTGCETVPYETTNYRAGLGLVETVAIVDVGPVSGGVVGTIWGSQAASGTAPPVATVPGAPGRCICRATCVCGGLSTHVTHGRWHGSDRRPG